MNARKMNLTTLENFFRQIPLLAPLVDIEQRLHQRYPIDNTEVRIHGEHVGEDGQGLLKDISKTGLSFQSAEFIPREEIALDILFSRATVAEYVPCRIMWRTATKTGETRYGARFENLTPEQAHRIDEFIAAHTVRFTHKFLYGLPGF